MIYGVGSLICHQRPERSFHLGAAQLPVCARCIGIYAGAAIGAAGTLFTVVRAAARWNPRVLLIAGAVPIAATLLIEWGGVADPGNVVRALSGVVAGAAVATAVLTLHYDECAPRRPIAPSR
jgi:uncharacterized membrane protein